MMTKLMKAWMTKLMKEWTKENKGNLRGRRGKKKEN